MLSESVKPAPVPFEELDEDLRVELVPQQIFDFRKNEPAFIFSRDNLLTIKRYEAAVRRLPGREQVEANSALKLLGLNATDINVFFDNLRRHADSWDNLEDACKTMGADLQIFAEGLITEGVGLLATIKSMSSWDAPSALPGAADALSPSEAKTLATAVDERLGAITTDITEQLARIRHVKAMIDRFGDDIASNLLPMASGLFNQIKDAQVAEKLAEIEQKLASLDGDIQKQLEQYNGLVGAAFYGLLFGPLGLAITGGIYGAQAEAVRATKNALIRDREASLADKKVLLGDVAEFESIKTHIVDMQFRLVEVGTAIKNLEDVWVLLESYAKNSIDRVQRVSTRVGLASFVSRFERVLSPWRNILSISKDISKLFNETVKAA